MSVLLSPLYNGFQGFLPNGLPNNGGLIYTYQAGTSTPAATYTTASGSIANANPITLNSAGQLPAQVWLTSGQGYKFVYTDSQGNNPVTNDNIYGVLTNTNNYSLGVVVTSIANLRTLSKLLVNEAFVTGYTTQGDGGGGAYYYDSSDTSSADNGGTIIVANDGGRWKLNVIDFVSVKQFGAVGNGVSNDYSSINNSLLWAAAKGIAKIYFPSGNYLTAQTINRPAGVYMEGDGPDSTAIGCSANAPVIQCLGTSSASMLLGGVANMDIIGSWCATGTFNQTFGSGAIVLSSANTNSYGIAEAWCNRSRIINVRPYSCYYGIYAAFAWQTVWDTIHPVGGGTQQCYIGFYMAPIPNSGVPSGTSNAVQAINCMSQYAYSEGFRLVNFDGSKFVSCEADGGGKSGTAANGWHLGDPPSSGTDPITGINWGSTTPKNIEFGHFANCLGDSFSSCAWLIRQGADANPVDDVQLVNCWGGNSNYGFYLDGCVTLALSNLLSINHSNSGIYMNNCLYVSVTGCNLKGNNTGNSASVGDITLAGGSYNRITGNYSNMANSTGKSLIETSGTTSNAITGNTLLQGATIISSSSLVAENQGFKTETSGTATVVSGNTTVSVTPSVGTGLSFNIQNISITPTSSLGSAAFYWITLSGSSFVINLNTNPGANVTFGWKLDLTYSG